MSKTQLKRELSTLSTAQLVQTILEAYDARKEIKEYFDFYLNPDVGKLEEKYQKIIAKEFGRTKWGYSKSRITVIKKALKKFASFRPGFDKEIDLTLYALKMMMAVEKHYSFKDSQIEAYKTLMLRTVEMADKNLVADKVIERLMHIFTDSNAGSKYLRGWFKNALQDYEPIIL